MSATYHKFHERLKEERLQMGLSQLEISQCLRMSQSHYSKAELGKRRLSYYEIQCLCETEANVYYIFTGEKCKIELKDFFLECTFEELECCLEILCVLLIYLHNNHMIVLSGNMQKKIENIQYALLLKDKRGLACEISYLLQLIDESKRKDILDSMKSIHKTFC